jgi:hypothetical protein
VAEGGTIDTKCGLCGLAHPHPARGDSSCPFKQWAGIPVDPLATVALPVVDGAIDPLADRTPASVRASQMRLWEIVDGRPARFHTIGSRRTTIGRGACDIRLLDPQVSREHCSIKLRDGVPILTDLASANGTFLNGSLVQEHPLADGDEIRIGSTVLRFHCGR